MKYSETSNRGKKAVNTGLYVIIALCLLIVGGAVRFAVRSSNIRKQEDGGSTSNKNNSYSAPQSSYNDYTESDIMQPPLTSTAPTADSVPSEPYSSKESTSSEAPKIVAFIMPVQGEIIKEHSGTQLQYSSTYGDMRLHSGIDIAAAVGTSVSACSDGAVESITPSTPYGTIVTIDHKSGLTVKYASLENLKIEVGDTVKAGDIIGTVGTIPSECMDKEHLHIEVLKNGNPVSPLEALNLK